MFQYSKFIHSFIMADFHNAFHTCKLTSGSNHYHSDLVDIFKVYTPQAHTVLVIISIIIVSSELSIIDTLKS